MHLHTRMCVCGFVRSDLSPTGLSLLPLLSLLLQQRTIITTINHRCVILTTRSPRLRSPFTNQLLTTPMLPQQVFGLGEEYLEETSEAQRELAESTHIAEVGLKQP